MNIPWLDPSYRIRYVRNNLLKESDFIMQSDVPIDPEAREQWIAYRQQLRDLPDTCDLRNPVWPEKPEYVKA